MYLNVHNFEIMLRSGAPRFLGICLIVTLGLATNTIGFDLYHHTLSIRSWHSIAALNSFYVVYENVVVHRYILGHYILYIFSIGLPPVWAFIIIQSVILNRTLFILREVHVSLPCVFAPLLVMNLIYTSMTGLAIGMLFIALLRYRAGSNWGIWFFLGCGFHPIGFFLGLFLSLSFMRSLKAVTAVGSVFFSGAIVADLSRVGDESLINLWLTPEHFDYLMEVSISRITLYLAPIAFMFFFLTLILLFAKQIKRISLQNAFPVILISVFSATGFSWSAQQSTGGPLYFLSTIGYPDKLESWQLIALCLTWTNFDC